jgi:hypothetical protein
VDLEVSFERGLTVSAGLPAQRIEAILDRGDGLAQARGEGGEVLLVVAYEGGIGLGGETFGQVERAGLNGVPGICSWRISRRGFQRGRVRGGVAIDKYAPPGGPCRKAPSGRYPGSAGGE